VTIEEYQKNAVLQKHLNDLKDDLFVAELLEQLLYGVKSDLESGTFVSQNTRVDERLKSFREDINRHIRAVVPVVLSLRTHVNRQAEWVENSD
jgi:hypothetical protein